MKKPQKYLTRMGLFCIAVLAIAALIFPSLKDAFMANAILNGVIIGALLLGLFYAFRRVFDLSPAVDWVNDFKKRGDEASSAAPNLMASASAMLRSQHSESMRMSTMSMRTVLDGIVNRLEESREISRYMTGLLIFLGLLGTFWGLLGTIGAIGKTINSLSIDGTNIALMFDELKDGLQTPLAGMGVAFSSSLFGLAGSLVLGFLDLQASQAQTRFYNDVEDWLSSVTKLSRGEEGSSGLSVSGSPSAYATAVMEQTAEGMERLEKTLKRGEEDRHHLQQTMLEISKALNKLADQSDQPPQPPQPMMDSASRSHLSNIDVGIKALLDSSTKANEQLSEDLRKEIRVLSRTIAAGLEGSTTEMHNESQPLTATKDDQ
ncbi:MotA/TolQ/ExbB proton channel family protein [Temperatibacter marinus]|uniref:MotA/TolQ/ExbB proton channel family protein n=1 Tax=Temperatibacter marinus TaxID=1456591 RepID=A0AA52H9N2_9PROT|nr:MotA/TolQ/ExbB proton channel family protein [Temperatibacter marinus]WND01865.1 MotA/TolQ/ExbB proton channel family protein [Temperatibacter marinus]